MKIFILNLIIIFGCDSRNSSSRQLKVEGESITTSNYKYTIHSDDQRELIKDSIVVVFYIPTDKQIEEQKKSLGEDNFLVIVDDNNYYNSLAIEFLDSLKIKVVFSLEENFTFETIDKKIYHINRSELTNKYWGALFFNGVDKPIFIDVMKIKEYPALRNLPNTNR